MYRDVPCTHAYGKLSAMRISEYFFDASAYGNLWAMRISEYFLDASFQH